MKRINRTTLVFTVALIALFVLFAFGCGRKAVKEEKLAKPQEIIVKNGVGKARKFQDALEIAKRDALKKAVVEIIGEENEKQNSEKLKSYVYSISDSFISGYQVTDKVKSGKQVVVYITAEISRGKLIGSIKTLEILIPEKKPKVEEKYAKSPYADIINEAIDNLTYLVYFEPEDKSISDEYARLCVNRVNNYLANKGYEYVDLERINEIKNEYMKLYEETQGNVSVVQLIAQALNADVYIVVDGKVEDMGEEGGLYFASASIDLKASESATGRGLGTETGYSGKIGLASGYEAARRKCVEVAVEKAIEPVINLARDYMYKAFEEGIRYEVVVQGIPSYSMLREFVDAVSKTKNFRRIKEVSAAPGQAKYYVYYMGRKTELIDEILNSVQGMPGFENFDVLVSRGNAVVFGILE